MSRGAECIFPPLTSPTGIQMLTRIFPMRSIYLQSDLRWVLWIRIHHFCLLTCGVYFNQSLLFSSLPLFFCLFFKFLWCLCGFSPPQMLDNVLMRIKKLLYECVCDCVNEIKDMLYVDAFTFMFWWCSKRLLEIPKWEFGMQSVMSWYLYYHFITAARISLSTRCLWTLVLWRKSILGPA